MKWVKYWVEMSEIFTSSENSTTEGSLLAPIKSPTDSAVTSPDIFTRASSSANYGWGVISEI